MKKIFILMFISLVGYCSNAQTPKTVVDFYKLLPDDQFKFPEGFSTQVQKNNFRKKAIKVTDIKNGYLKLDGRSAPTDDESYMCEVVLFKKKNNSYLVGLSQTNCMTICEGTVKFLEYTNSAWTDVTKSVFTLPTEKEIEKYLHEETYFFALPRTGKTMMMINDLEEKKGIKFEWNGERFAKLN